MFLAVSSTIQIMNNRLLMKADTTCVFYTDINQKSIVDKRLGATGMDITPLWWALAFGAGFGGNGTIIGSTANIIVTTLSEKTCTPITSSIWNRHGLPVMLVTCAIASLLYILMFKAF
jgi:Na+/H+ antiporter NhaD/arsenite permease-like protein